MRLMKDSEIEWIGEVPEDWVISRIRAAFSEVQSKNHDGSEKNALKFKYGTIIQKSNFNAEEEEYVADTIKNYTIVEPDDIIINGLNLNFDFVSIRSGIVVEHGIITSAYLAIRPNKNIVFPKFANYLFRGYDNCKAFHNMGVGLRKTLNFDEFKHNVCLLPALPEQCQIVSFLEQKCSAIDTAIAKTQESIAKLEEYKKAVITKAVTKGLDPNVKMKDSGIEWIGEVPEEWNISQLRTKYSERKHKNSNGDEKNLLSLSYGNIVRKDINSNEGLLPESFNGYNIIESHDIVMRLTDLQNDKRSLRTGLAKERGIITSAYVTLQPILKANSDYYHYLLHAYDLAKVYYHMGGGLRQSLDYSELCRIKILVPSEIEQRQIVDYIDQKCVDIDSLISKKKVAIEKWTEYKKSLIYYAVTGKIDCTSENISE